MRHRSLLPALLLAAGLLLTSTVHAEPGAPASDVRLTGTAELGFLAVLDHNIQLSTSGTDFDYDTQGGQDVLFAVSRFSVDVQLNPRHTLVFLYQPLELRSREVLTQDLVVDELTFPAGTAIDFTYGFPFYRASYLYDFDESPDDELSLGASLQIRNASISFESTDGTLFRTNRGVGPVPVLKARWRKTFEGGYWLGMEADGFYAPISIINGSDNEVVGAILDASARVGVMLPRNTQAFLNVRYLGGGAVGSSEPDGPGDGYVRNWLHFLTVTLGFALEVM